MTSTPPPGRFIAVEGIDGSGKTTLARALADWLPTSGLMPRGADLVVTREPGGTPLGQEIRRLLLDPPDGATPCPRAELLLFLADRAQHVETVIRPALEAGHWVLTDRFSGSTVAYQGYGRGNADALTAAADCMRPDLTLWLDVPAWESMERRRGQPDRMESDPKILPRVVEGFREQYLITPDWFRINATLSPEQVLAKAQSILCDRFQTP